MSAEMPANDTVPHEFAVKIRQSFYEGLSRQCLDQAWERLNSFRASQTMPRLFRGEFTERRNVPLFLLAEKLHRTPGELSRWFQGHSPEWSNLMMVMTGLDADWESLQPMAKKAHRRSAGCMAAVRFIRRTRFGIPGRETEPAHFIVMCLEALFSCVNWETDRRFSDRRHVGIERVARETGLPGKSLDSADLEWGDSYRVWAQFYADSMDEQLWS